MGKAKKKKKKKEKAKAEKKGSGQGIKLITDNRKARYLYAIDDELEAGIVLTGTEVKSCRQNRVNLTDAYALEHKGEFFLQGAHISPYDHGNIQNHEPRRLRKLLLHKKEMGKLFGKLREKGYTLVPLKMYFKGPYVKVKLGLGKGKKLHDKRKTIRDREHKREMDRHIKRGSRDRGDHRR